MPNVTVEEQQRTAQRHKAAKAASKPGANSSSPAAFSPSAAYETPLATKRPHGTTENGKHGLASKLRGKSKSLQATAGIAQTEYVKPTKSQPAPAVSSTADLQQHPEQMHSAGAPSKPSTSS